MTIVAASRRRSSRRRRPRRGPSRPARPSRWTLDLRQHRRRRARRRPRQDTLPPGFAYVSSSSSPSLGAPTVIPGRRRSCAGTSGRSPATRRPPGTITVTARAGAVTSGTGDPPHQTFTNNATLTRHGRRRDAYTATASADVDRPGAATQLGKTVDKTFRRRLPGSGHLHADAAHRRQQPALERARVRPAAGRRDVAAATVGQGGTYGAYTPIAAVPATTRGRPCSTRRSPSRRNSSPSRTRSRSR